MRCPVCRGKLSDYLLHLMAMSNCRRGLYDRDRVMIIDRQEILEGTLYREQSLAHRTWWVRGLNVHGNRVSIREFQTKAVADIFMDRARTDYGTRGGDVRLAFRPRLVARPTPVSRSDEEPSLGRAADREIVFAARHARRDSEVFQDEWEDQ